MSIDGLEERRCGCRLPYRPSGGLGEQPRHPDQIVGGHCQRELEPHAREAAHLDLGEAGDRLAPAEGLLDELAFPLADLVARVVRASMAEDRAFRATCGVIPSRL